MHIFATFLRCSPLLVLTAAPLAGQGTTPALRTETTVSLGAAAQLAATRLGAVTSGQQAGLTTEGLQPSIGALATFRQVLRPWLGYAVNFGYTHPSYHYTQPSVARPGDTVTTLVPAHMYEVSVSYIASRRLTSGLSLFGEAGGGAVGFAATDGAGYLQNRSNSFVPVAIAGFGSDIGLGYDLGLRAQYRGLILRYPYPDYASSLRLRTVVSEPTLSLTYRFGRPR